MITKENISTDTHEKTKTAKVTFLPENVTFEVPVGTNILDAGALFRRERR